VRIDLDAEAVGRCIDEIGFGFMFAPAHHAAMRHVVPVRKELGVRTVFNFLGPLTNPAGATRQVIGVSDPRFQDVIADALAELGCERAWVVASSDGFDELSTFAPSRVVELGPGGVSEWTFDPAEHGLAHEPTEAIAGGDPTENAEVIRSVFGGGDGPTRDLVVANAAAAIAVGSDADLRTAVERAREVIDSGAAADVLERLVALTGELAPVSSESG
jgi:anthranilate phosphoribosyltransferase